MSISTMRQCLNQVCEKDARGAKLKDNSLQEEITVVWREMFCNIYPDLVNLRGRSLMKQLLANQMLNCILTDTSPLGSRGWSVSFSAEPAWKGTATVTRERDPKVHIDLSVMCARRPEGSRWQLLLETASERPSRRYFPGTWKETFSTTWRRTLPSMWKAPWNCASLRAKTNTWTSFLLAEVMFHVTSN